MIPELAVAMLACARIGAVHSIVFGGFSADSLADRIADSTCTVLITCNGTHRGDKPILLKPNADEAMEEAERQMGQPVTSCIVVERVEAEGEFAVEMKAGRDEWWHDVMAGASADCPCEVMDAEDPLYILYTSGSTGKPKGVQHNVGGYMVYTAVTHKLVFDYHDGDIYFCAADIGWVTGHSYIIYGPLGNGATTMMFEGIPTWPNPDRYWQIVEKWQVNQFYTAPTAIRAIAAAGEEWPAKYEMPSPAPPRHRGRADQPRGLALVPPQRRQGALPHRRYLVADRDRRHPDHAAAGRDRPQAGVGDLPLLRHRAGGPRPREGHPHRRRRASPGCSP